MCWTKLLSGAISGQKDGKQFEESSRSLFERDYDRIIFSHPFRRLQDKTQVFPLPEHDFVHTRLTHSLEVSSVGRSLGKKVGEKIIEKYPALTAENISAFDFGAIVAAACLTHDLGNPPFGHAGEDAISDFFLHHPIGQRFKDHLNEKEWADISDFEGNAQGFRLLNKRSYQGLQLTAATRAAFTKYPRESVITHKDSGRCSHKKYGFFQSEKVFFEEVATQTGLISLADGGDLVWVRHPLAFLVEAADDICYHLIDLEDGCRLGLVGLEDTIALFAGILKERFKPEKLEKIRNPEEKIGLLRALAIGELIDQCVELFLLNEAAILTGDFDQALTDKIEAKEMLSKIKKVSIDKIYRSRTVLETEAAGFEVITGLLEAITTAIYNQKFAPEAYSYQMKSIIRLMPAEFQECLKSPSQPLYDVLMAAIDIVASMTDSYAISFYRKIKGISLPGRSAF